VTPPADHAAAQRQGRGRDQPHDAAGPCLGAQSGLGVTYTPDGEAVGVAPNELPSSDHSDPTAGAPCHKHVPARLKPLAVTARGV
jgi:hypothetical protein